MLDLQDINNFNKIKFNKNRYIYEGEGVPRVTEIISKTVFEEALLGWSNKLGFKKKKYENELDASANLGTLTHSLIEKYLHGEKIEEYDETIPFYGFKRWWSDLNNACSSIKIIGEERKLVCPWFGGTYDLYLNINNNQNILVDFKTSKYIGYKYFIQLAAYDYLLEYNNLPIPDCYIILQLDKVVDGYYEYYADMKNPNHRAYMNLCRDTFFSMVYSYYHILNAEKSFKKMKRQFLQK